jgi:hypothetical protein
MAVAQLVASWRHKGTADLGVISDRWLAEYRQGHDW